MVLTEKQEVHHSASYLHTSVAGMKKVSLQFMLQNGITQNNGITMIRYYNCLQDSKMLTMPVVQSRDGAWCTGVGGYWGRMMGYIYSMNPLRTAGKGVMTSPY